MEKQSTFFISIKEYRGVVLRETWWHIGMSSASGSGDPSLDPDIGENLF